MSNGLGPPAIVIGQSNSAYQSTGLYGDFSGGTPIFFVGPPWKVGGSYTQQLSAIWALGNGTGFGVFGMGGAVHATGVVGSGGTQITVQPGPPEYPVYSWQGGTGVEGWGGGSSGAGSWRSSFPNVPAGDGVSGVGGPGAPGWNPPPDWGEGTPFTAFPGGAGVAGFGGDGSATLNIPPRATSIVPGNGGVGVFGAGGRGDPKGAQPGSGVVGTAEDLDPSTGKQFPLPPPLSLLQGNGVAGQGPTGVLGFSGSQFGVQGVTSGGGGAGVVGAALAATKGASVGAGVLAIAEAGGMGVWSQVAPGSSRDDHAAAVRATVGGIPTGIPALPGPWAGWFDGPVQINGDLIVTGVKHAAVPFPDGSHRLLYCMESPECWFEDFGEAKLVKGKAQIKLPRDFATAIKTDSYHVFLTPYGNSNGLYVSKRNRRGFVVEEQGKGKSNLEFSFRIVGKRKGVKAERFAKVSTPKARKPPKLPTIPKFSDGKQKEEFPKKPVRHPLSGDMSALMANLSSQERKAE